MKSLLLLMQSLADETRLRILMALRTSELCVCQIQALLKLAPSTVSVHMRVLHHAGLVEKRRQGKWVFFRLAKDEATPEGQAAFRLVSRALTACPKIESDRQNLEKLLRRSLPEVCLGTRGAPRQKRDSI
ncbi:MAG TPA: metalloregulator ArsR/SmtB family transcription factor [Candidatus Ozemobacteraceae bacterium]|nr:metalloregulator ArsR/SmtB family transcription factor [Candidatus Ozemobacteraceae bacterium]